MKVLFTTQPALSHLHPLAPLAGGLADRGHQVTFACARQFCPKVEASGFSAVPAGINWDTSEEEQYFPRLVDARAGRDPEYTVFKDIFAGATARAIVPDLLEICRTFQPDVIVRDPVEFGGCIAGELLDIPHACGRESRFQPPDEWNKRSGTSIHDLRRDHGLPPDPDFEMPYRYLAFAWAPRRFIAPPGFTAPYPAFGTYASPVTHFIRPAIFDTSAADRLPDWVHDMPDQPTVVVTLGTVFNKRPDIFSVMIEGLRDAAVNVIVTVGTNQDATSFGPQPPNVHIERYIPLSLLMPFSSLVFTAGGFGTVMTCLSAGVPMVFTPIGADQPVNAGRSQALGVGLTLDSATLTPADVRRAADTVLGDPGYRRNAEALKREMEALPGTDYALDLLEQLAAERRPIKSDA